MKQILLLTFLVCTIFSCRYKSGSGHVVTEKRNVPTFKGVNVGGDFDVELRQGSPAKVVVEADDNIIEDIETNVVSGQLRIRYDRDIHLNDVHMKVFITAPEINSLKASASAEIVVKDQLSGTSRVDLQSSSGAVIRATLDVPEVVAGSSSGSDMILSGRTRTLKAEASSGSSIKASELMSENTTAKTSSGANIRVHASVTLKAYASSGGEVNYRGGGSVSKEESSGGSVNGNN